MTRRSAFSARETSSTVSIQTPFPERSRSRQLAWRLSARLTSVSSSDTSHAADWQTIHSPQHCLPGAGWAFESSRYTWITADNGKRFHVGEYVISDGTIRQFVLYWYQAHGRSVPNEYAAKLYMIADAIRYNRTDGALVRVISPVQPNESIDAARERVVKFTGQMAPSLAVLSPTSSTPQTGKSAYFPGLSASFAPANLSRFSAMHTSSTSATHRIFATLAVSLVSRRCLGCHRDPNV